jgi:hypothetical protein
MPIELKEWVDRVFGGAFPHDAERSVRLDEIRGPDQATLVRLTEVFENAPALLQPYSDEDLNQAIWDLGSEVLHAVGDESIGWPVRHRLVQSFETLFRELFAVRCRPVLGHCNEEGSPLNSACYMWWDFNCWPMAPDPLHRNPLDSAFLGSMRSILTIDHVACEESALHGLGHWHLVQAFAVESIIDDFLKRARHLSEPLREYASWARRGYVQ